MTRQNKLQDPTEAAMSAIEEALRLDQSKPLGAEPHPSEPKLPSATEGDLEARPASRRARAQAAGTRPRTAGSGPAPGDRARYQPRRQ